MVQKMNKAAFIEKLEKETAFTNDKCILINDVLENNSLFGKKNLNKIINDLMLNNFTEDEAENIYDIAKKIIFSEIKNKLKNPFKSKY